MRKLGCIFFLLLSNFIVAQIKYEKGYFIDNFDQKIECLIKNEDWVNNPEIFKYKLIETEEEKVNSILNVKEFGIQNFSKYIRSESKIDNSNDNISQLKNNRNPEWITKTIFLRLIVDGKYKLYDYVSDFQRRYFYSASDSSIEQLVFKKYLAEDNVEVKQNKTFQQQLLNNVICEKINKSKISKLNYNLADLEEYFLQVNNCGIDGIVKSKTNLNRTQSYFNLKIKGGIGLRKIIKDYTYNSNVPEGKIDFGDKLGFRSAVELEYFLPFNKNNFSFFFEPSYVTKYESEKKIYIQYSQNYYQEFDFKTEYNAFDLTIGPRYYFNVYRDLRMFLNFNLVLSSGFKEKDASFTKSFGFGAQYKKLSFDVGLHNINGYSKYRNLYMSLGYSIFDTKNKNKK